MNATKISQMTAQVARMTDDEIKGDIDALRWGAPFPTEYQIARYNALQDEAQRREDAWKLRHAA